MHKIIELVYNYTGNSKITLHVITVLIMDVTAVLHTTHQSKYKKQTHRKCNSVRLKSDMRRKEKRNYSTEPVNTQLLDSHSATQAVGEQPKQAVCSRTKVTASLKGRVQKSN